MRATNYWNDLIKMSDAERQVIDIVDENSFIARQMFQKIDADESKPTCNKNMFHFSPAVETVMPALPFAKLFAEA